MSLRILARRLTNHRSTCVPPLRGYCSGKERDYMPKTVHVLQIDESRLPPRTEIDVKLVHQLERLSLVHFSDADAVRHLQKAIDYADILRTIDIPDGIEPMVTVHDDSHSVPLRDDSAVDCLHDCVDRKTLMALAADNVDGEYYVTPPGNVAVKERELPAELLSVKKTSARTEKLKKLSNL